jgi:hypothetical protein
MNDETETRRGGAAFLGPAVIEKAESRT